MPCAISFHPVVRACIAIAACAAVSACVAQTPAPPRPEAGAAAPRPPLPVGPAAGREAGALRQEAQLDGRIARFVINPEGSVDGLVLEDGTLVRFPPRLGTQVVGSFRVGAPVRLMGMRSANGDMRAEQLISPDSGVRLLDQPPAPDGDRPPPPALRGAGLVKLTVSGEVARLTTAPRGEPDGVMLRDGTVIKLTPPGAQQFTALLQPGTKVEAEGYGSQNQYGRALQATAFGASGKLRQLYNQQPN
jgi:hypothetical protein